MKKKRLKRGNGMSFLKRLLLIMKLTTFLIFLGLTTVSASIYSQSVKLVLDMNEATILDVFKEIEAQSEFVFFYKDEVIDLSKKVNVKTEGETVDVILDNVLKGLGVKYEIVKKQIIITPERIVPQKQSEKLLPEEQQQPQKKQVQGTVSDALGQPIPGASVIVKGTTVGTITDFDGNFALDVPADAKTLSISFVGMKTQELPIVDKMNVKVALEEMTVGLGEVVAVGYGIQKKESVVGSIVQVKGEDILKTGNVPTVSEALQGLLPGVTSMQIAGLPGATQTDILIRGKSTWGNSDPLIMVDGIERDFNNVDLNEIESISVLKDASATAVFGVKAANGVILLTTKKGVVGKPVINYTSTFGIKIPTMQTNYYAPMEVSATHYNIGSMNDYSYDNLLPQSFIDAWADPNRDKRIYSFTDWIDELFGTGFSQSHNLNLRGGNDFVRYFTSFGYNYEGDIFKLEKQPEFDPRTYNNRYNYRANLDFQLTKSTVFSVKLSGDISQWNGNKVTAAGTSGGELTGLGGTGGGEGQHLGRIYHWPMVGAPIRFETGEWGTPPAQNDNPNYVVRMQMQGSESRTSNHVFSDMRLEQDLSFLLDGLKVKATFSYGSYFSYGQSITANVSQYYYDTAQEKLVQYFDAEQPDVVPATIGGKSINTFNRNLYYDGSFTYDKKFGKHTVGLLGLFLRRVNTPGVSFPSYEESWVGRATYDFDSRYLFEFNSAYNGSEKFAPGYRFGFFPSMAVGWVVTNEPFLKDRLPALSFLKFKYSYGEVGSDRGAKRFTYISLFSENNDANFIPYYGDPLQGYGPLYEEGDPANPYATWERSIKQNLGIETGFFKNMLTLNVDLFDEKRDQILMERKVIPWWFGASSNPEGNIGATKNHGIEFELGWRQQLSPKLSYWLKGNLSLSENRVVFRDDLPYSPDYQKLAGKPISYSSGLMTKGYLQSWDDVFNWTTGSFTNNVIPGDFKYVDYNADGVITAVDRIPLTDGSYAANSYAFSFGATFGQFSLVARFNGVFNITKELEWESLWPERTRTDYTFKYMVPNVPESRDYWTPENPNAARPIIHAHEIHNLQVSDFILKDASFLRFRTLELSYSVPKTSLQKTKLVKNLEFYVNGNNLYTWTGLSKIYDPEAQQLWAYPLVKRYNLGIKASF